MTWKRQFARRLPRPLGRLAGFAAIVGLVPITTGLARGHGAPAMLAAVIAAIAAGVVVAALVGAALAAAFVRDDDEDDDSRPPA